jgi:hypothetical protein
MRDDEVDEGEVAWIHRDSEERLHRSRGRPLSRVQDAVPRRLRPERCSRDDVNDSTSEASLGAGTSVDGEEVPPWIDAIARDAEGSVPRTAETVAAAETRKVDRPHRVVCGKNRLLVSERAGVSRQANRFQDVEVISSGTVEEHGSMLGEPLHERQQRQTGKRLPVAHLGTAIGDGLEESLGLGIKDRRHETRESGDPQRAPDEISSHASHASTRGQREGPDAGERTRTSKGFRPTGPKPAASASSATPAGSKDRPR